MTSNINKGKKLINIKRIKSSKLSKVTFVWAHGWMRTHEDLQSLASQMTDLGDQYLIDLPAHGDTCPSSATLDIDSYLEIIDAFIKKVDQPIIWIGHSFGCRIGAHMGQRHPEKVKALFLICPPFNKQKSFSIQNLPKKLKQLTYKTLIKLGVSKTLILPYFASKDYLNAGSMKNLFVKWVNEDSSAPLKSLSIPVKLIFAEKDDATPPELDKYFKTHCKKVTSIVLKHFDHYSILTDGQHQLIHNLTKYIEELHP